MKRIIAGLLALLIIAAAVPTFAYWGDRIEITFSIGENFMNINGTVTEIGDAPYIADDLTLVPLDAIKEAFGAGAWYSSGKQHAGFYIDYPYLKMEMTCGSTEAELNGESVTLPTAPSLGENGSFMVPLRFMAEALGAEVTWDDAARSVGVVKEEVSEDEFCDYSIERLNISFSLPASLAEEYFDVVSDARYPANEVVYKSRFDGDLSSFSVGVYAISEEGGARELAESEQEMQKYYLNGEYFDISDISEYKDVYFGENAVSFDCVSSNLPGGDFIYRNIFFEIGDFAYSILMTVPTHHEDWMSKIINSIAVKEIDEETAEEYSDSYYTKKYHFGRYTRVWTEMLGAATISYPTEWYSVPMPGDDFRYFANPYTRNHFTAQVFDLPEGDDAEECAEMLLSQLGGEYTVFQPLTDEGDYYTFSVYTEGKNGCRIYQSYVFIMEDGKLYAFHITQDASTFGESENDEFLAVAKSLEILEK